jgi:RHS repeat-associated protein
MRFLQYRYTGKERDTESGNDYFGNRYYGSNIGRWISPDPGWFLAAHLSNPQSWNLYAYVLNNPLGYIDPEGLESCSTQAFNHSIGISSESVWCHIANFFSGLFGSGGGSGSTAVAGGGGAGGAGGPGYPGGGFIPDAFMVPTHSWIERYPKGGSVLRNFWETQGPKNVKGKFGVREYITGFDPGGEDNNADGTYSDKDTIVNNSPANQYDDTLGCPGGLNCQKGVFWQRFTVTMLWGPDKGKQVPVLIKVNGQLMRALHWQNNGPNPTMPLDFPGSSTLPGATQSAP